MKVDHLVQRRNTRGAADAYVLNFLRNASRSARLMHRCLGQLAADKQAVAEAMRWYLVGLVSCLETYYRDLCVHVAELDETVLREALRSQQEKARPVDFYDVQRAGVTFPELAGAALSFQSIEEIERSMSPMFADKGYLKTLDECEYRCILPSKSPVPALLRLWPEWRGQLASAFRHRHALVHDANAEFSLSSREMASIEAVALIVPQVTAGLITAKFGGKVIVACGADASLPTVLLASDLIADDWIECDNDPDGEQGDPQGACGPSGRELHHGR